MKRNKFGLAALASIIAGVGFTYSASGGGKFYRDKRADPRWLIDERKAKAEAKRERKQETLRHDYATCVVHNPCLSSTGKNWMTAH